MYKKLFKKFIAIDIALLYNLFRKFVTSIITGVEIVFSFQLQLIKFYFYTRNNKRYYCLREVKLKKYIIVLFSLM